MSGGSDLDDLVALLHRTPAILDAWLNDLPDAWLQEDEGPGTFSLCAALGHLILGERTDWMPRGLHPVLGPVTRGQLLATWATHDLSRVAQVARVMARTQDTGAGPLKECLGVLAWRR